MYTRAFHVSGRQRKRAEERLDQLSLLQSPSLDVLKALPKKAETMFNSVAALPPLDPAIVASINQIALSDPGKRQWETSKTGYLKWAVGQLLDKTVEDGTGGRSNLDTLTERVSDVGNANSLRTAVEAVDGVRTDLNTLHAEEE